MTLARQEGVSKLSIRNVAATCGVATGSIYNYFPSKAELVLAVTESFWREVFHGMEWPNPENGFPFFFEELYQRFRQHLETFRADWLTELSSLTAAQRQKGKETEAFWFLHIQEGLLVALKQDSRISPTIWTTDFTPQQFAGYLFDNLLLLLKRGDPDCAFFRAMLERLLYGIANPLQP